MWPMNIAETPITAIQGGSHRATGDGVHLVARHYPKGRWLVPPDRAVWVPARLEHAIDVLADIDMRTLYFDLPWLAREHPSASLDAEFVVRVSQLLHQAILALFDGREDPGRTGLLVKLAMLELHQAE